MYIVKKPEYIESVQKHRELLSFSVVTSKSIATVRDVSKEASDVLATNSGGAQGDWGLGHDSDIGMWGSLMAVP